MKPILRIFLMLAVLALSCDDNEPVDCPPADRTGAVCNDGTTSTATGSGACSGHGGVDYWLCK